MIWSNRKCCEPLKWISMRSWALETVHGMHKGTADVTEGDGDDDDDDDDDDDGGGGDDGSSVTSRAKARARVWEGQYDFIKIPDHTHIKCVFAWHKPKPPQHTESQSGQCGWIEHLNESKWMRRDVRKIHCKYTHLADARICEIVPKCVYVCVCVPVAISHSVVLCRFDVTIFE